MTISIAASRKSALPTSEGKIRLRLGRVLADLGLQGRHLSILFGTDLDLRRLNFEYRRLDKPTNVLAFPDTQAALGQKGHLGDVALSMETLRREAKESGESPGYRLYYYLIHAILHLAGHDHERGEAEDRAQHEETERLMGLIRHDL